MTLISMIDKTWINELGDINLFSRDVELVKHCEPKEFILVTSKSENEKDYREMNKFTHSSNDRNFMLQILQIEVEEEKGFYKDRSSYFEFIRENYVPEDVTLERVIFKHRDYASHIAKKERYKVIICKEKKKKIINFKAKKEKAIEYVNHLIKEEILLDGKDTTIKEKPIEEEIVDFYGQKETMETERKKRWNPIFARNCKENNPYKAIIIIKEYEGVEFSEFFMSFGLKIEKLLINNKYNKKVI